MALYAQTDHIQSIIIHEGPLSNLDWYNYTDGPNALLPPEDPLYDPADRIALPWYDAAGFNKTTAVEIVLYSVTDSSPVQPYIKLWGTDTQVFGNVTNTVSAGPGTGNNYKVEVVNNGGWMHVLLHANDLLIFDSGALSVPYYDTGLITHTYRSTAGAGRSNRYRVDNSRVTTEVTTTTVATSDLMDVFLSDNVDGSLVRQLLNEDMVDTSILNAMEFGQTIYKVADMDERDLIRAWGARGVLVLVLDPRTGANADATVTGGAAMYTGTWNRLVGTVWTKVYEAESLDLVFDYADILNTPVLPNSTASEIDQMVINMNTLQTNVANLFSAIEDGNGDIVYNGSTLTNAGNVSLATVNW